MPTNEQMINSNVGPPLNIEKTNLLLASIDVLNRHFQFCHLALRQRKHYNRGLNAKNHQPYEVKASE